MWCFDIHLLDPETLKPIFKPQTTLQNRAIHHINLFGNICLLPGIDVQFATCGFCSSSPMFTIASNSERQPPTQTRMSRRNFRGANYVLDVNRFFVLLLHYIWMFAIEQLKSVICIGIYELIIFNRLHGKDVFAPY